MSSVIDATVGGGFSNMASAVNSEDESYAYAYTPDRERRQLIGHSVRTLRWSWIPPH